MSHKNTECRIKRRDGAAGPIRTQADLSSGLGSGPWLVVSPHDDDFILGMGLCISEALKEGIEVYVAVVSDGRMGYANPQERAELVFTRHKELMAASAELGIEAQRVIELGYPDGSLTQFEGCNDVGDGIAQVLTGVIRAIKPRVVFAPTGSDLHPDHRVVQREVDMACCWAESKIWLEKGAPHRVEARRDYAVYCAFPRLPEVEVRASQASFEAKMKALKAFQSQECIEAMVERLLEDGPIEYFQLTDWQPYRPSQYAQFFESPSKPWEFGGSETHFSTDCRYVLELLAQWPKQPWQPLVDALEASGDKPLLLVGEGSSQLFPGGFATYLAKQWGMGASIDVVGGREASTLPLERYQLCFLSNSGQTRELLELLQEAPNVGRPLALLGSKAGPLYDAIEQSCVVLTKPEKSVPATASVFGQALVIAHALSHVAQKPFPLAAIAAAVEAVLNSKMTSSLTATLASANRVWWADAGDQVGAELALKTMEVAGCSGSHASGNLMLHGVEEVLGPRDLVVRYSCASQDDDQWERIQSQCDAQFLRVGQGEMNWNVSHLGQWAPLVHLVIGWRLLGGMAQTHGHNPDAPRRARKVGNPWR